MTKLSKTQPDPQQIWFYPTNLTEELDPKEKISVAFLGMYISKILDLRINSFMGYYDENLDYSRLSKNIPVKLQGLSSPKEFSEVFPFDLIFHSEKIDADHLKLSVYLNGKYIKSIDTPSYKFFPTLNRKELATQIEEELREEIDASRTEFRSQYEKLKNEKLNIDIDMKNLINNKDKHELLKLFTVSDSIISVNADYQRFFRSGAPLDLFFFFHKGCTIGPDKIQQIIEFSSQFPESFVLRGDPSNYDEEVVDLYNKTKIRVDARMKMEGIISDNTSKAKSRSPI